MNSRSEYIVLPAPNIEELLKHLEFRGIGALYVTEQGARIWTEHGALPSPDLCDLVTSRIPEILSYCVLTQQTPEAEGYLLVADTFRTSARVTAILADIRSSGNR